MKLKNELYQVNLMLNTMDDFVKSGAITREELADAILKRHVMPMKYVMEYAVRNLYGVGDSKGKKKSKKNHQPLL